MADQSPIYAPFFGVMGAASAIIFSGKFVIRFTLRRDQKKKELNRTQHKQFHKSDQEL